MRGLDEMDSTSIECPLEKRLKNLEAINPKDIIIGIPKVFNFYIFQFNLRNIIMNFFRKIVVMLGIQPLKHSNHLVFKYRIYLCPIQPIQLFVIIF